MENVFSLSDIIAFIALCCSIYVILMSIRRDRNYDKELSAIKEGVDVNRGMLQSHAYDALHRTAMSINYKFLENGIDLPVLKDIYRSHTHDEKIILEKNTILLLHQINLFYMSFLYRDFIGESSVDSYKRWVKQTVKPWVYKSGDMKTLMRSIISGTDLYEDEFLSYLRDIFDDL